MPLYLSDDQAMLLDIAKPFMAEQGIVSHIRVIRDTNDPTGFSRELWMRFGEMGFAGILVSQGDGGLGLGHVEAGIILEQIGRNLTLSPFLITGVGGVTALQSARPETRAHWMPRIITGETVVSLAIDESAKHRPAAAIALKAERAGNGFKLSGVKRFVAHGHVADLILALARTSGSAGDEHGLTVFAIGKDASRFSAKAERLLDASLLAQLQFDGVAVSADAVVGEVDNGWATLSPALNGIRVGAASELLGVGSAALEMTISYLKERKQFGRAIGSFQALQHRAAYLYVELDVARAATLKAQQLLDAGAPGAEAAAMVAKAVAGLAATLSVQEGVQMHGGIGMTDEHDIGLCMKRARVLAEMFGDADYQADQLARYAGY